MRVNTKDVVGFALLPGIWPRLKALLFSGFDSLTFVVALVLYVVRLIPKNHPIFLQSAAAKDIGVLRLMAEAARNLQFRWRNIDQIIIFTSLLCGIVMLFLYMAGLVAFIMSSPVMAAAWDELFQTPYPEKDIAFMMLDKTFGIPGLYGSEVSTNAAIYGPFPNAFHLAMWELFSFFSMGIFIIALFIFLYHVVTIVFEITQTGKTLDSLSDGEHSFGWLPLRYLIALGLLLPVSNGLNSGQWITLYVAKFGSGLATNAWYAFNDKTGGTPIGDTQKSLVAVPTPPDTIGLIKNLLLIKSCYVTNSLGTIATNGVRDGSRGVYDVKPYVVLTNEKTPRALWNGHNQFLPDSNSYNATPNTIASLSPADPFIQILDYTSGQDINIVYGYFDDAQPTKFSEYPGGVLPVCGKVIIPVTGFNGEAIFAAEGYFYAVVHVTDGVLRPAVVAPPELADAPLAVTREWRRTSAGVRTFMSHLNTTGYTGNPECVYDPDKDGYETSSTGTGDYLGECTNPIPGKYWKDLIYDYYSWAFEIVSYASYDFLAGTTEAAAYDNGSIKYSIGDTSYIALGFDAPMFMNEEIIRRGWGGAGLWYNKISERNGALYTAISTTPMVHKFPMVMENMKSERGNNDAKVQPRFCEQYNPRRAGVSEANTGNEQAQFAAEMAKSMHVTCAQLHEDENLVFDYVSNTTNYNNPIIQTMAALFSQAKLFDLRDNDEVTPLAQLSAIGRLLIDKAIINLIAATGSSAAGGMLHIAGGNGAAGANSLGQAMGLLADSAISFAILGLSIGVLLHYVLPFMPFIYFFFAIGTWVKSIFEALVGIPLWALAHLSSKGAGLPGEKAASGYFLLLEIMLRPVVTVFALIAAFAIFSGAVSILNGIFSLVTSNVLGSMPNTGNTDLMASARGMVDQFFYTILYIIIVYMIGSSAFKLINLIPDGILRWSGMGVDSFGKSDRTEDLVSMLPTQVPIITQQMTAQAGNLIKEGLYKPAAQWGMKKEKEAAEAAALAAEKRKAVQAEKQKNSSDGGAG